MNHASNAIPLRPSRYDPPLHLPFFFFTAPPPTEIYTLSLHDALPISFGLIAPQKRLDAIHYGVLTSERGRDRCQRSEEHTSELQSRFDLVCRLLLEKKKKYKINCFIQQ